MVWHHGTHNSVDDTIYAKDDGHKEDTLLTCMAAHGKVDTNPGDIRFELARCHAPSNKTKKLNGNEAQNTPDTVTAGNVEYYLNNGETIAFNS
jgi:hypothetical protein